MFNKKIITVLILLSVFVVGLQMAEPVEAVAGKPVDKGSFTVNGAKIKYDAQLVGNSMFIEFNHKYKFMKNYQLTKVNKNQFKAYKYSDKTYEYKHVKTYTSSKSLKNFYFSNYKNTIVKDVKSDAKKVFKK